MSSLDKKCIMIVAGETSGDEHAAALVKKLQFYFPEIYVYGMAGSNARRAGMDTIVDSEKSAGVMGLVELWGGLSSLFRAFKTLVASIKTHRPQVAILLDFPDFNLRLARVLKRRGVKVLYFISPQIWAWRKGRIKIIKKYVDKVAAIFPFEEEFYAGHGVDVSYVGHPFLDLPADKVDRAVFASAVGLDPELPIVALLPGSRKSEVERLLVPMVEAFSKLRVIRPGIQAVIPVAPGLSASGLKEIAGVREGLRYLRGHAQECLKAADLAVVASGTATVQAAICGVPLIIVYKLSNFTCLVAKLLVRGIEHFGMPNVIAGRKIVEELLQEEVTPQRILLEMERLLGDAGRREKMQADLVQVKEALASRYGSADTARGRVACMALEMMGVCPVPETSRSEIMLCNY